jgi:hypothetical protein
MDSQFYVQELSDEQLEQVVGGSSCGTKSPSSGSNGCEKPSHKSHDKQRHKYHHKGNNSPCLQPGYSPRSCSS